MPGSRFSTCARGTALLALAAILLVPTVVASGLAAEAEASGEPCVGCFGCETGECEDGEPGTHHHCCVTCCMTHASVALPVAPVSALSFDVESMSPATHLAVIVRTPEAPYRPPRA